MRKYNIWLEVEEVIEDEDDVDEEYNTIDCTKLLKFENEATAQKFFNFIVELVSDLTMKAKKQGLICSN